MPAGVIGGPMVSASSLSVRFAVLGMLVTSPVLGQEFCSRTIAEPLGRVSNWSLDSEMQPLLEQFAPVYSFALGEQYFPVMPFFTAFDGEDNGGSPAIDLADSFEVAPMSGDSLILWQVLDNQYRIWNDSANRAERRKRGDVDGTVFVQVRPFNRNEKWRLLRFLKSDEQAWDRLKRRELISLDSLFHQYEFVSLEYYLYYIRDDGLQGHPEDIEFAFIFLPYKRQAGGATTLYPDCFRVITGGGHTWRTPNNVLVLSPSNMPALRTPSILVELGGHSSAPDLNPAGTFQPGVDVNWHAYDVWGTRDVQAVLGQGFDGQYDMSMTFPRDTTLMSLKRRDRRLPVQAELAKEEIQRHTTIPVLHREYNLMPVVLVESLAVELEARELSADRIQLRLEQLEAYMPNSCQLSDPPPERVCFRGFRGMDMAARDTAIEWMKRWHLNSLHEEHFDHHFESYESPRTSHRFGVLQARTIPREKHRVWDHEVFRRPATELLKGHLYRPSIREFEGLSTSLLRLLTYGFSFHPSEGYQAQIGVIIPAVPIAVRLPGVIEIQAGVFGRRFLRQEHSWSLAILHDHFYSRFFSWYAKLTYVKDRSDIINEPEASDIFLSAGPSFLLSLGRSKNWYGTIANSIRLRSGLRFDLGDWNNVFRRVGWEFQIGFRQ
jgi:hypothetical protein